MADTERVGSNGDIPTDRGAEGDSPEPVTEREAYFRALRLWTQQAQFYQNLSTCFPYYMMTFQTPGNPSSVPLLNNNYQFQGQPWPMPNIPGNVPQNRAANQPVPPAEIIAQHGGFEYVIPPLYKRLIAEFIDFVLLFIVKLMVTFILADMFDFIDMEKFDFNKLSDNMDDYRLAMEFSMELVMLEVIYKILVAIFEALCLQGGAGRIGGATPGKAILGLRVITASAILPVAGRPKETVLLYPGQPLPFMVALGRSVLKNLLISLLFPLCFILFVFKHNRTGYDMLCGVIVVEENMFPPRRNAP